MISGRGNSIHSRRILLPVHIASYEDHVLDSISYSISITSTAKSRASAESTSETVDLDSYLGAVCNQSSMAAIERA
jgi:hypothetical protein